MHDRGSGILACVLVVALVLALVMALPGAAHAQQPAPVRLTLQEAQARAVDASHRLAEARARRAAAEADVDAQAAAARPIVSALAGYTRTNHVEEFAVPGPAGGLRVLYPDVPDNYRTRLDLQWPIYSGGRTDALERAARAEAAAADADLATARADLRLEVARAFWASVTAAATVNVLTQGVSRAGAHVADVQAHLDAGFIPPNELASAQAQEARQRMLLIQAQNQRTVAAADLARLTGLTAEGVEADAVLDAPPAAPPDVGALIESARGSRSERKALASRVQAAGAQREAASAARRPGIALAAGVDYARPNPRIFPRTDRWDDSWDAGINVNWPLWDGGRSAAGVARADSLTEAARQRLAEFDSVLAVDIARAAGDIMSGQAAVAAADEGVRAATEARRVVNERYQAGVISEIEVLDADFALLQAELDRTRALADVRLAEARLSRAAGR